MLLADVPDTSKAAPQAISALKVAAETQSVPGTQVLAALVALQKAKVPADKFLEILGGHGAAGGKRWRLIFTSGSKQLAEVRRGGKAGGRYFPINACQRWDTQTMEIENGIYLGQIVALTFKGPFEMKDRKLSFTFDKLRIRLGPKWFEFPLKPGQLGTREEGDDKGGPFFIFNYADDDICAAVGRGGGAAFWAATTPTWDLQAGVDL